MKPKQSLVQWFIAGMGHIIGITPYVGNLREDRGPMEAIGGDFNAIGDDLQVVMDRHPATRDEAIQLGEPAAQLELAGIR